jgi:hypothetical protein
MSYFDDLPFYDHDPDAQEQATEASKARVALGFTELLKALQQPLNEAAEADAKRKKQANAEINRKIGIRDGHFVPPGCSIPISPTLAGMLEKRTPSP